MLSPSHLTRSDKWERRTGLDTLLWACVGGKSSSPACFHARIPRSQIPNGNHDDNHSSNYSNDSSTKKIVRKMQLKVAMIIQRGSADSEIQTPSKTCILVIQEFDPKSDIPPKRQKCLVKSTVRLQRPDGGARFGHTGTIPLGQFRALASRSRRVGLSVDAQACTKLQARIRCRT